MAEGEADVEQSVPICYTQRVVAGLVRHAQSGANLLQYFPLAVCRRRQSAASTRKRGATQIHGQLHAASMCPIENQSQTGMAEPADHAPSSSPTLAQAIASYLEELAARGRPTAETARVLRCHVLPQFGERQIDTLTRAELRRWHRSLAQQPPIQGHRLGTTRRSPATANRILTCLKAALNHAWHEGEVASDAAWRAVRPFRDAEHPRRDLLTPAEARRLIEACTPEFEPLVRAALATGCRYGELVRLEVGDFDAAAGTLWIRAGKSGRARHVAATDEGVVMLRALTRSRARQERLFLRADGASWGASHQHRRMRKACAAAGITPPIGFHALRRSFGSWLARAGVPLQVIAAALGHADTRITERHYAHLQADEVARMVRANVPRVG